MDLTYSDEQRMLADAARRWLGREYSTEVVRELEADPAGVRRSVWPRLVELGWPSLAVSQADGGSGGRLSDLVVLAEELGRAAAATPLLGSVGFGALPLAVSGAESVRRRWLPGIVDGQLIAAGCLLEPDGRSHWPVQDTDSAGLTGAKTMVGFAGSADVLLVSTRLAGLGPALVVLPSNAPGIRSVRLDSLGPEPVYAVDFDRVPITADDMLAEGPAARALLGQALEYMTVLATGHAVGLCEGALALAVTHAKDRVQFGRPIGAFQTVSNRLVEVRSEVDALRLLTYRAAAAIESGAGDAGLHVATMKAYAGATARTTATETHQVMGAIGFTMEHDLQLYTRSLKAFETTLGTRATHLAQIAHQLFSKQSGFANAQRQQGGFANAQRQQGGFANAQRQQGGFANAQRQQSHLANKKTGPKGSK